MTSGDRIVNGFVLVGRAIKVAATQKNIYWYVLGLFALPFSSTCMISLWTEIFPSISVKHFLVVFHAGKYLTYFLCAYIFCASQKFLFSHTHNWRLVLQSFCLPWYAYVAMLLYAFYPSADYIVPLFPSIESASTAYFLRDLVCWWPLYFMAYMAVAGWITNRSGLIRAGWVELITVAYVSGVISFVVAGLTVIGQLSIMEFMGFSYFDVWWYRVLSVLIWIFPYAAWLALGHVVYTYLVKKVADDYQ